MAEFNIHRLSAYPFKYVLFVLGFGCVVLGWYHSYPVSIPPPGRFAFENISVLVWPGLSLVLTSLYLISRSASKKVAFLCATVFVFFVFSYYLFFPLLPGPDAHTFRARAILFSIVGADPAQNRYFQWPSFFVLNDVLTHILGLDMDSVSVLVFVVTGFLLSCSLFLFFSAEDETLGFCGVALYFVGLFWFLNYQFAPQSLALGFFFVLVNLTSRRHRSIEVASLAVFTGLVFLHAFIAPLFILYYFILTLRDRTRLNSLVSYCVIYLGFLVYFAVYHFQSLLETLPALYYAFLEYGEYRDIVQRTFSSPVTIIDAVAQVFSRGTTISIWGMLGLGFLARVLKRDIRTVNLAMLFAGLSHLAIGLFLPVLGARALQIVFVPFVSGYRVFVRRTKTIAAVCLILVLILFPFNIIHQIYDAGSPTFLIETPSGERASEALIKSLQTRNPGINLLSSDHDGSYIVNRLPSYFNIWSSTPPSVQLQILLSHKYDYVIYSPLLEKELSYSGLGYPEIRQVRLQLLTECNRVLDDGYSSILACG